LVIRFAEEKHAADPGQSWLLVRDRDLLRQLMLTLAGASVQIEPCCRVRRTRSPDFDTR
jgi:hypothetical protein